jgi:cystathionine beta-lyase
MSHAALSPEEKKEIGISEGLIRISAGLENTDDLTAALKTVLEKLT